MKQLSQSLCLLILALSNYTGLTREFEGSRTNSILLNGQWEFVRGDGSEGADASAGQASLSWQPGTLPGLRIRAARPCAVEG